MVWGVKRGGMLENFGWSWALGNEIHEMGVSVYHVWKMPILHLGYPSLAVSENDSFFFNRSGRRLQ